MAQRSPAVKQKDYIQRQYLIRHLRRELKYEQTVAGRNVLHDLIAWVKAEKSRTTRSGGL